jgi:glycosyltransferase involved in cell wall biosynthesis
VRILFNAQVHLPYLADLVRCVSAHAQCHIVTTQRQLAYLDAEGWRQIIPDSVTATIENDLPDGKKLRFSHYLRAAIQLKRTIRSFRPDLLQLQESFEAMRVIMWTVALSRVDCPIVLTVHDPVPHLGDASDSWKCKRRLQSTFRRRATRIVTTSNTNRRDLLRLQQEIPPSRVGVVPHHVLSYYRKYSPAEALHVPARLLFFGRMVEYKGIDTLAEAWQILRNSNHDVTLTIAGSGDALKSHIGSFASDPNVTILNRYIPNEEAARLFSESQLVLLPYKGATQSGVVGAALAFGRACVASDAGSISEMVEDGKSALLVPPGEPTALAETVLNVLDNPDLRDRIEKGAAQLATGRLSPEAVSETLIEQFKIAMNHK